MNELLPCPFCGSEARSFHDWSSVSMKCSKAHGFPDPCPVGPETPMKQSLPEAVAAWNTRALERLSQPQQSAPKGEVVSKTDDVVSKLVERLRELLAKATPGPWKIDARPFHRHGLLHLSNGEYIVAHALGEMASCEMEAVANATIIVEAINALPALLDALERLSQPQPTDVVERACLTPGTVYRSDFHWDSADRALTISVKISVPEQYKSALFRIYNTPDAKSACRAELRDAIHDAIEPILAAGLAYPLAALPQPSPAIDRTTERYVFAVERLAWTQRDTASERDDLLEEMRRLWKYLDEEGVYRGDDGDISIIDEAIGYCEELKAENDRLSAASQQPIDVGKLREAFREAYVLGFLEGYPVIPRDCDNAEALLAMEGLAEAWSDYHADLTTAWDEPTPDPGKLITEMDDLIDHRRIPSDRAREAMRQARAVIVGRMG